MNLNGPITDVVTQDKQARWRDARLGRFTASVFSDLICANRKPTQMFLSRCAAVAAERLTGMEAYSAQTKAMEWGQEMEQHAFEFLSSAWVELEAATFVPFGENAGCTPDAYATVNGRLSTVDLKCPFNSSNFIQFCAIGESWEDLKDFDKKYAWQVACQGRWCETELCSIAYVDPRITSAKKWRAITYPVTSEMIETIDATVALAEAEVERFMALMS